ncbi:Queuine tRNA-ribosyltransferase subunit QTRTD1 [Chelonia mydas]|uniref:Queuine tRNA-ribosyltransferase accessory subunit 2 n=1 Tax=Chelonia mydas TaxID=8469 RepID=M7B949_CHEMY|nr:Queuine tRNA-ribosyltransferase subunit QTRTD1 [Chelonia mydas]
MKLSLSKVVSGCRLGTLTNLGKNGVQTMELPGCLLYTKTGSPPHLTHDTLQAIKGVPAIVQLTLSTLVELHEVLEEYKEGIGKFIGMPESVLYCSLHDPGSPCPPGYNNNKVPKRAKKSVDRSLFFLDECLQLQEKSPELQDSVMVGVIEGGDMLEERLRSARETAKRPVGGFLLDGFQGQAMAKETKLKLMASVTAELPEDKPRLIHGIGKPDEVLECIERGVDVFESFFPYQVTERGCALSFSYDYNPDPEAAVIKQNGIQDAGKNGTEKDINETSKADPEITSFEIFLKEKRYRDDFGPLVHGCTCYCCQNHSRAYVHHLLVTNELLAGVLLMMHNFQHYFSFFHSIRDALRDDRLDQLKKLIFRQAL